MKERDEISYRLALADGFLAEAKEDVTLQRWRSVVDNAQSAVENAGKAVLALFGVPPKTHDTAKEIAAVLRTRDVPPEIADMLKTLLPDLLALGSAEHFMTDYGDEGTYTLPWELFSENSASEALEIAKRSVSASKNVIKKVQMRRGS